MLFRESPPPRNYLAQCLIGILFKSDYNFNVRNYVFSTYVKKGFTLAEVLITLGIIGIVAAVTIPTLVSKYQEKAWSTSAQVFERRLEEALKTMNTQQTLAGYTDTAGFLNELSQHFKIHKICKNTEIDKCFENTITWNIHDIYTGTQSELFNTSNIHDAADMGQDNWGTEVLGVQFVNGTTGLIAYNPDCKEQPYTNQFSGTSCISLLYDTNGFKTPNSYPKDIRSINAKFNKCAFKRNGTCFTAPFKPAPITKAECEALKTDLGITACNYDTDYWAGAVNACGGKTKMPTQANLATIAAYIYGINVNSIGTTPAHWDKNKADELGFFNTSSDGFIVWANNEYGAGGTDAYVRWFYPNYTMYYHFGNRNSSNTLAICLAD